MTHLAIACQVATYSNWHNSFHTGAYYLKRGKPYGNKTNKGGYMIYTLFRDAAAKIATQSLIPMHACYSAAAPGL